MVVIETERLRLRDFEEADWEAVHEYASDLEVVRYIDWGPNTLMDTQNFMKRAIARQKEQPRKGYDLAVMLKVQNRIIGGCGIHISNPENREGWIGYVLNREFWERATQLKQQRLFSNSALKN